MSDSIYIGTLLVQVEAAKGRTPAKYREAEKMVFAGLDIKALNSRPHTVAMAAATLKIKNRKSIEIKKILTFKEIGTKCITPPSTGDKT